MKLRKSIFLNIVAQSYTTLLGVVTVPVLQIYMGSEAYGLVAFFSALFVIFYVLDLGLTPMVQREYTRFAAGVVSALEFRRIWRAFGVVFASFALTGAVVVMYGAGTLVQHWLKLTNLSHEMARQAVVLMGFAIALRWWGGMHRGVISGAEHMVWLVTFNALMATLRFAGVLVWMYLFGYDVLTYFAYQLGVAVLEWGTLIRKSSTLLPHVKVHLGWSIVPLRSLWRLGAASALGSLAGSLFMQVDRTLLSGVLLLEDYGHYSMAVLVASTVMVISTAVSMVLMPRLARLQAEGHEVDLINVYRMGTRLTSALVLGGAMTLAFCAQPLLIAWTGEVNWASEYWTVLSFYACGYGLWAMSSFVYYLQYARGQLHWQAWCNVAVLCVWSAIVWWAGKKAGAVGVAQGWVILNVGYMLLWTWVVHARYLPGLHGAWLVRDVLSMNWPVLLGMVMVKAIDWEPHSRGEMLVYVVLVGGGLMALNMTWWAWIERRHWMHLIRGDRYKRSA